MPASRSPTISSVVATGRRMNGSKSRHRLESARCRGPDGSPRCGAAPAAASPCRLAVAVRLRLPPTSRGSTLPPGRSWFWPSTTTCSPAARPLAMIAALAGRSARPSTGSSAPSCRRRRRRRTCPAGRAAPRPPGITSAPLRVSTSMRALHERVRPQRARRVRHQRLEAQRRGRLVDLVVEHRELAGRRASACRRGCTTSTARPSPRRHRRRDARAARPAARVKNTAAGSICGDHDEPGRIARAHEVAGVDERARR